jgi:hypothetical protein
MYYSYMVIEYVAMSFSPARTDLALKLLNQRPLFDVCSVCNNQQTGEMSIQVKAYNDDV